MVKPKFTEEDNALLAELGVEVETKKIAKRTPQQERIIAGFEEIEQFTKQHGRLPEHGESKDIFERLFAVRLDKIRTSSEYKSALDEMDTGEMLEGIPESSDNIPDELDDDALLSELGVNIDDQSDITKLTHVRARAEIRAAEEIAQRDLCQDFERFKPLFVQVQEELSSGERKSRRFKEDASIVKGEFFILGGQVVYVAEVGEEIRAPNGAVDARLRVIYDNGTESDLLMRSLQRALYKDDAGRRITDPSAGPLFSDEQEDEDIESGTIYVLRSKSEHPAIAESREVLHKIGVTGGNIEKRISNAKTDPTFLMADVEVIATYELSNINRTKLENLIHKFFESARLNIEIKDRFDTPVSPREWFLVPIFVIDDAIEKIKDRTIVDYYYDPKIGNIVKRARDKSAK